MLKLLPRRGATDAGADARRDAEDRQGVTGSLAARAAEARFRRRRRDRRRRMLARVALFMGVVGLVVGGVWLVFFSPVLAVHGVNVTGTHLLSVDQVRRTAEVPLGVPVATSDLDAVEARVETLAAVRTAHVSRDWPDGLTIEVTERQPVAVVERDGSWHGLDRDGVLFRTYPQKPPALPQVQMTATTSVDALAEAAAVVSALPADILRRVDVLDVATIDSISFRLKGGATVTWGSADDSAEKARVLEVLMHRQASAYDVTAPGRPTIRP